MTKKNKKPAKSNIETVFDEIFAFMDENPEAVDAAWKKAGMRHYGTQQVTPRPPDNTQKVLDWLKSTISPSQLPEIPSLEDLQAQVVKTHGLDDHEVCIELDIRFSEQAYADAHKPGGLYSQFVTKGYRWSSDADKWFNMNKIMEPEHAVMVKILVG